MATTGDLFLGEFNIASVDRLRFPITKDGSPWIGLSYVVAVFQGPDRITGNPTTFMRSLTLETPDAGVWYYDTPVTDFLLTGIWTIALTCTQGSIVKTYPYEISMQMNSQPTQA